ncbi:unnamed protein product [Adineta ricciae]|uniref:FAD/NAD(P)-binding domain-containing protein n=1 Tax=Adineta ricciae TaxID=249248 RepID=A0A813UDH7_ADIRI|nr:unnamed protein product [Adineta ricciae]CAF1036425.1 unnamed protein product [Adineta ricciae]
MDKTMNMQQNTNGVTRGSDAFDVVIVGSGFAGLFMLHELRKRGYSTKVFEAADEIGGTWNLNRYPGARCDIESMQYSYSFSDELQQDWHWSERFARQPEILRYLNHVADKFDLNKDIQLNTRVTSIVYNENQSKWTITTGHNDRVSAKYCVMATGCLSVARDPKIPGLDQFKGNIYRTTNWPKNDVSFIGRRVAVIGTGASGVQCIPMIAKQAAHLYVIQRTPNFVIPTDNKPVDVEYEKDWKSNYNQRRSQMLQSSGGIFYDYDDDTLRVNMTDRERFEIAWQRGGLSFFTAFKSRLNDNTIKQTITYLIHEKIREIVRDPVVAAALLPYDHLFGTKRPCVAGQYYDTFNLENVTLVDIRHTSIDKITEKGILIDDKLYEIDDLVLATGFDAVIGSLLNIDIHGRSKQTLREKWTIRPRTLLGIMIADFPNLFTITGPGSPINLSNMIPHIEENVKWIIKCIDYLNTHNIDSIEAKIDGQNAWMDHVDLVASQLSYSADSFAGNDSNILIKPSSCMRYAGGLHNYLNMCEKVTANGYEKFFLLKRSP